MACGLAAFRRLTTATPIAAAPNKAATPTQTARYKPRLAWVTLLPPYTSRRTE